jgi:3-dehydroquinate synthetase
MFHDKKTADNQLNFILLKQIGSAFISKEIDKDNVLKAINQIIM